MPGRRKVPDYCIIQGSEVWADKCREFCRKAYLATYLRPEIGITEELFSKDVFSSPRITKYFKDLCRNSTNQRFWVATDDENEIFGMVVAFKHTNYCEMKSFYVEPRHKGQGIGHALYQKVLVFAASQPIQVDVIEYLTETIDMYRHWGFNVDESKGKLNYDIVEWPESARLAYRAVYMVKPGY
jgi:GNAT superfamily N-acetyltransferase